MFFTRYSALKNFPIDWKNMTEFFLYTFFIFATNSKNQIIRLLANEKCKHDCMANLKNHYCTHCTSIVSHSALYFLLYAAFIFLFLSFSHAFTGT